MDEPAFISTARVAIWGLGLMGGSMAMALHGKCASLLAIDPDPACLELALRQKVVDKASTVPADLLPEADVVILAAPIHAILAGLGDLPRLHPAGALVLDLGSTKAEVVARMAGLPSRFDPVGGHPICGKEVGGFANAEAGLFQGATFVLAALPNTTPRGRARAADLVAVVGALPLWMEAGAHDRWIASTSHLPYLLALALALATPPEAASLVGPGFRSTSRVAATPASIMMDILATNRLNVLATMERCRAELDELHACLQDENWAKLEGLVQRGAARQAELISGVSGGGRS